VKYAFIERHRAVWPIARQCQVLKVSASGYRPTSSAATGGTGHCSLAPDRDVAFGSPQAISNEIRAPYGWPRIWRELSTLHTGKERVRKLMKVHGLRARGKRNFKATTNSSHGLPVSPNLLNAGCSRGAKPGWAGDITYW